MSSPKAAKPTVVARRHISATREKGVGADDRRLRVEE